MPKNSSEQTVSQSGYRYRLYNLDELRHVVDFRDFRAMSDLAAIVEAGEVISGQVRELWQEGRRVVEFPHVAASDPADATESRRSSLPAKPLGNSVLVKQEREKAAAGEDLGLEVLTGSAEDENYYLERARIERQLAAEASNQGVGAIHHKAAALLENLAALVVKSGEGRISHRR